MFHLFNSDLELFKSILEEKEKNYKQNLIKKKAAGEPVFFIYLTISYCAFMYMLLSLYSGIGLASYRQRNPQPQDDVQDEKWKEYRKNVFANLGIFG